MQEWKFEVAGITLRGKRWGRHGATPIIALHGWLDNCASFDFVAPLLNNVDLIALDLAGQGKSDHRQSASAYNIWDDILEVISVAEQLGWKKFGLLGHSRGAMIATLIAGAFPERITHLALVESFAPQMLEPEEAPQQLASAIQALMNIRGKERSVFTCFEEAVEAREQGFLKLSHQDALALAKRGVKEENGKFCWNNDLKLNAPSEVKFTPQQVRAFVARIAFPIELIVAETGLVHEFPLMKDFITNTPNIRLTHLAGDHHLHMSQQCEKVADVFNAYFSS